jgi:hypothetical protein
VREVQTLSFHSFVDASRLPGEASVPEQRLASQMGLPETIIVPW